MPHLLEPSRRRALTTDALFLFWNWCFSATDGVGAARCGGGSTAGCHGDGLHLRSMFIVALLPPVWERSVDGLARSVWGKDSDHTLYSLGAQAGPWGLWHRQLCQADKSTLRLVRSVMTFKLLNVLIIRFQRKEKNISISRFVTF